jgi:hypothetical protein
MVSFQITFHYSSATVRRLEISLRCYLRELREIVIDLNFLKSSSVRRKALVQGNCVTFRVLCIWSKELPASGVSLEPQIETKKVRTDLPIRNGRRNLPVSLLLRAYGPRWTMHHRHRMRAGTTRNLQVPGSWGTSAENTLGEKYEGVRTAQF